MALYNGWNLDEMRLSGVELNEVGNANDQSIFRPMSSFTPINAAAPTPRFISPQKTLHNRDIYEIIEPPEERSDVPVSIPKKRGRAQSKGHAVSIGPLREYVDDGDLAGQNNGVDFETRRRRSAPAKRAKSSKNTTNNISQLWSADDTQVAGLEFNALPGSQLTTPPESGNKKGKRVKSAKVVASSKPKMGPFKVPTITKPVTSQRKDAVEEPSQSKPNTYLGFVTTQESVKLAKTTLDALAAFRYVPLSATQLTDQLSTNVQRDAQLQTEHNADVHTGSNQEFFNEEEDGFMLIDDELHEIGRDNEGEFVPEERDNPSILFEHGPISGNNAFFADATWDVQMSSQLQYGGQVDRKVRSTTASVPVLGHHKPELNSLSRLPQAEPPIVYGHFTHSLQQNDIGFNVCPGRDVARNDPSHSSSQYEPNSSEARELQNLTDTNQNSQQVPVALMEQFSNIPDQPLDQSFESRISPELVVIQIDSQDSAYQHEEPSSQDLPVLNPAQYNRYPDPSKIIQVDRSDTDNFDMVECRASNDYDLDDFDEGLDDFDFLELVSRPIVPVTQPVVASGPLSSGHYQKSSGAANIESHRRKPISSLTDNESRAVIYRRTSLPHVPSSELENEFPFDDDLENEMMKLVEMDAGVVERFEPPASLQLTLEGGSRSGEVYDKSLQFSPPKPLRNAGSSDQQTDQTNSIHSPPCIIPESLDEEDWSFIRSKDESNYEGHIAAPVHIRKEAPSNKETISPNKPRTISVLSPAMTRRASTSQMTTSINGLIDDSHEYEPLKPFARPDFPILLRDRSPIVGLSPQNFLRVCFRVAEMLKEGARCHSLKENAMIELFVRVIQSSREPGTTKQHFTFADLWHDHPPFPHGLLANYKSPELLGTESNKFIGAGEAVMARCFGRLKRDFQNATGWLLDIVSIRKTDWEEIRWTKRLVSAGAVKSETRGLSKL